MKSESLISSDVTTNYSEIHSRFQLRFFVDAAIIGSVTVAIATS